MARSSLTSRVGSKRKRKLASDWLLLPPEPMKGWRKSVWPVGSVPRPRFMLLKNSLRRRRYPCGWKRLTRCLILRRLLRRLRLALRRRDLGRSGRSDEADGGGECERTDHGRRARE